MDTNFIQIIIPIILLSLCAGILFIENLHYLYILYSIKGKLYLSTFFLGCAGFVFVASEIAVILFGIMNFYSLGKFFHIIQAITAASFLIFLPLFLYYLLDLNLYNKIILKTLIVISAMFLIFLIFIVFFKQNLFLDFNKTLKSSYIKPWNVTRGHPGIIYSIRDILILIVAIFSIIFLTVDLFFYKKYFYIILPLIGAIIAIISGVIDILYSFKEISYYGLYSLRNFSFFCFGVTIFIMLSMLSVMKKFISQTKEVEKALKLKSLGVLAGGIAHDFNNILSAVIGNISLLKFDYKNEQNLLNNIKDIEKAVFRAKGLTNQLLTFSKGGSPVKDISSINEIIEDTVLFILSGSHIKVKFNFDINLWNVNIDKDQISQVIQNITINARDAMPQGGTFFINVSNHQVLNNINIKKGKYIKIDLMDQGKGIPKNKLKYIFEPYYTTKTKGSGLGLFVCYSIINNHNGYINITSEVNKGSCFTILLPAVENKIKNKKNIKFHHLKLKAKALILDDESTILNMIKKMLSIVGIECVCSKNGEKALQIFKKNQKNNSPFDLVILDLTIKGGIGGKDIIKKIKHIYPKIKAIVSSGYSNDKVISEYKKYGFDKVLKKPFTFEELIKTIQDLLNK